MKNKMSIGLIGRTKFLLNTAQYLLDKGLKLDVIITSKNASHDKIGINDFKIFAAKNKIKFYTFENINNPSAKKIIEDNNLDLGISVNNPLIIKKEILDLFKFGILNAHAGDLPRYRGNACPNWAILKNEKKIAITIHFMSEKLDAGNIILKKFFPIKSSTNIKDFYDFAEIEIPKIFFDSIKKLKKNYKGKIQKGKILRTYPRNMIDGKIDWNDNISKIDCLVRASGDPFFGAYTYLNSSKLIIIKAEKLTLKDDFLGEPGQIASRNKDGSVSVCCKDGILKIIEIKYKNKIYKSPSKLIKTIHTKLGMDVEQEIENLNKKLDKILRIIDSQKLS